MFIAALLTITKVRKQPRCHTTDEWIKKMLYIYTYRMEFYSTIRKNDTMRFESKWIQLETIMLNEVSQAQKDKDCMFSLICGRQIQKIRIYTKTNIIIRKLISRTCL
jgi:hypothetical protein